MKILGFPRRILAFLVRGEHQVARAVDESRRAAKSASVAAASAKAIASEMRALRKELALLGQRLDQRMAQNTLVLTRAARAMESGESADVRLSGRAVPVIPPPAEPPGWAQIAGVDAPDPGGADWLALECCPTCGHDGFTVVNPWNKLILLETAPDDESARYDYAVCHGCGVLFASRRPSGARYTFLLEHFGEVTAKRGSGGRITNQVLNPEPLSDADRTKLRRLAARGVFVSDHLGIPKGEYLAPLLRDRFENSAHIDVIGSLLEPRGWRVLEVRSRAGTILDGLRRAWGATVYAMPIWESQQLLLREVYGIETSDLIDFDRFSIPFEDTFELIVCNHMLTHVLRPREFFAEVRRKLRPGGHIYLHNEPDDAEFLKGNQSMLATLNPLHVQAFDQASVARALAANGFHVVFQKHQNNGTQFCLATLGAVEQIRMTDAQRDGRITAYRRAYDRAVLKVEERVRPRLAGQWTEVVERAVVSGVAEFDERGQLRIVSAG